MRKDNIAWTALTSHLTGMKRNFEQISAHYGCYLNKITLQSKMFLSINPTQIVMISASPSPRTSELFEIQVEKG